MDGSRPKKQPQQQQPTFDLDSATEEIARSYGVPSAVWRRMVGQESGGDEKAVSPKGARTAWQIMDATARGLGYDPEEIRAEPLKAAEGGLRILRDNYRRFRPNAENEKHAWMMAVAGYHTNPNNVARDLKKGGLGLPMTSDGLITTRDHVLKIFDGIQGEDLQSAPGAVRRNPPKVPRVSARPLEIKEVSGDLQQSETNGIVNQLPDAEARIGTIRAPQKEPAKFLQSVNAPEPFPLVENAKDAASEFIQNGRPTQLPSIVGGKVVPLKRRPNVPARQGENVSVNVLDEETEVTEGQPTAPPMTTASEQLLTHGAQPLIDLRDVTADLPKAREEALYRALVQSGISPADAREEVRHQKEQNGQALDKSDDELQKLLQIEGGKGKGFLRVNLSPEMFRRIGERRAAYNKIDSEESARERIRQQILAEQQAANQAANEQNQGIVDAGGALTAQNNEVFSPEELEAEVYRRLEKERSAVGGGSFLGAERAREEARRMDGIEYGVNAANSVLRGVGTGIASLAEAPAIAQTLVERNLLRRDTHVKDTFLGNIAQSFRENTNKNFKVHAGVQDDFLMQSANTAGQLLPALATGGISRAAGLGARGIQIASGLVEGGQIASEVYQTAINSGQATEDQALYAALIAAPLAAVGGGVSERLIFANLKAAIKLDQLSDGLFTKTFMQTAREKAGDFGKNAAKGAGAEYLEETYQNTVSKLTALGVYRPEGFTLKTVTDSIAEAAKESLTAIAPGGATGAIASSVVPALEAVEPKAAPLVISENNIPENYQSSPAEPVFTGTKGAFSLSEAADALARQRETAPQAGIKFLQNQFGLDSATAKSVLNQIEAEMPKARYFTPEETAPPQPAPGTTRIEFKDASVLDISEEELRARGIETDEQIQEFIADPENVNELLSQRQTERPAAESIVGPEKTPLEFDRIRDAYDHFKAKDLIDEKATSEGLQKEQPEIVLSDGRRFALENKDEYLSGLHTKAKFVETAPPTPNESSANLPGQTEAVKSIRASAPELITEPDSINLVQDGKTLRSFPNTPKGKIRAERQLEQARIAVDFPQNSADIRFLAKGDAEAFAGNRNAQTAAKEQITAILDQSGLTRLSPVRVVQSENDLPAPVRERIEADNAAGQITGVFHGEDLYLVADNLKNSKPEEILKTAAHEIVGHKGLRALLNDKLNPTLDRIAKDFADDTQFKIIAEGYGLDLSTEAGRREAAEELIAHRSEEAAFRDTSHYQRLRAIVRNALREISAKAFGNPDAIKWTDAEIDALIGRARRRLEKNAAAATTENDIRFSRSAETEPEADILRAVTKDRDSYLQTATNLRRAGLVSSVRTHLRNVSGNTAFQASEEAARGFAYFADRMIAPITGEHTVSFIDPGSVAKSFAAVFKSDGRLNSANSTESGIKQAFNILRHGDSAANLAKAQLSEPTSGNTVIDSWVKLNFRTLGAEDALFKVYGFRRSIEEQAKTLTFSAIRKDKSINRGAERRKLLDNPTPEMIAQASLDADFLTFQNSNAISSEIQKFKDVNEYGRFLIEQIAPFDKTPTNIVLRALDYTPAGLVRAFGSNLPNVVEGAKRTELGRETARERFAPVTEKQQNRDERFKELLNRRRRREDAELQQETETVFKKLEKTADALDRLLNKPTLTKTEEALRVQLENKIEDLQQQYVDLQQKQMIRQKQREFNDLTIEEKQKLIDDTLLRFFTRQEQREFSMNIGRATLGTGLMALGYALAANGMLAGIWDYEEKREKGKKRPDDRAAKSRRDEFFWRREHGIENGSLLIPGFGRVVILDSPGGKILTLGATLFEQSQHRALYAPKGKESYFNSLAIAGKTAKTLATEQPLLRTADSYLDSESKTWEEWTENQTGSYLGSFVPLIAADVGEVLDDRPRKSSGFKNAALRRIPVIREKAEESKLRVPTAERGGTMRKILRAIDPFNTRQVEMKPYIYGTPKQRLPEEVRDALDRDRREQ